MKRYLALVLIVCLLSGMLSGCVEKASSFLEELVGPPAHGITTEPPRAEPTKPVNQGTEPVDIPETKPQETEPMETAPQASEPVEVQDLLTFQLTQETLDALYETLEKCREVSLVGEDLEAADELSDQLDDQYAFIQDQQTIAFILYCCDQSDEALKQQHLDATDTLTQVYDDIMHMLREVYLSGSPANAVLFEDWTEEELLQLERYTSEVAELEKRNEELVVEYQALDDDEMHSAMIPLYIELVQNNNRIAEIYGYDNYYEYAYRVAYDRDYDMEAVETARMYAADYLAPAMINALQVFSMNFQDLTSREQSIVIKFMDGDYRQQNEPYLDMYLESLPPELQENMLHMQQQGRVVFSELKNAREGAFTATVYDEPICYFGPGYTNTQTLAHELGHYAAARFTDMDESPLDLCELQSQGNEWMMIRFLEQEMDMDAYAALRDYKMVNDMATIMISMMVDEFEQKVYSTPDISSFTRADFEAIADEVMERYGGADFVSYYMTDFQWYWKMVVMESPVYYISYAVSGVAAMNLYTVAAEDQDRAMDIYTYLVTEIDPDAGFLGNLREVGLAGPFEPDVYEDVYDMYVS